MSLCLAPQGVGKKQPLVKICFTSQGVGASDPLAGWGHRKKITVDHNQVSGSSTLTGVVILVNVTDTDLSKAKSDGSDFRITTSNGQTIIPRKIEKWVDGTGELILWFKGDLLHDTDTEFFIYYDNPSASAPTNDAQVWDGNYKRVYHMDGTGNLVDSTGTQNATTVGTTSVAGKIGDERDHDGLDDTHNCGDLGISGDATVEFYMIADADNDRRIYVQPSGASSQEGGLGFNSGTLRVWSGTAWVNLDTGLSTGTRYYVVITYVSGTATAYIDGVAQLSGSADFDFNGVDFVIGDEFIGTFGNFFDGHLDEFRVSDIGRSADLILTQHNNYDTPGTFMSFGAEETL